ncbi:hypothetical protein TWF481_001749 [Arthrobotrys musiformis]|uniref:F-box domain-containing protein n=1 Tax=Arthrobotrys musiformis TaxID=47236 RepID=A0AAV9VWK4_9PEZI
MPLVGCMICGARIITGLTSIPGRPWLTYVRFLTFDDGLPPRISKYGCLVNTAGGLEPEVYDPDHRVYIRTGARVGPFFGEGYDGRCYAVHDSCWKKLVEVAEGFGGMVDGVVGVLVGVFEAGLVVRDGEFRLGFGHGFGGVEGYWERMRRGGVDEGEYLEVRPWGFDGRGVGDGVGGLKGELEGKGVDLGVVLREGGYWVPVLDGLPVEIMIRVLEFMGGDEVIHFGAVGVKRRVKVPEGLWRREFSARGEVGWAVTGDFWKGREDLSWFERYLDVRGGIKAGDAGLKNLGRVFGICEQLLDVAFDVCRARVEGVEGGGCTVRERAFGVVIPAGRKGVERYLRLERFKATGVMVSYTGSGKMRFVSGMRFLPGGEGVGIVNVEDEVYVELFSKVPGVMVLAARFGEFGITGITTTAADGGLEGSEGVPGQGMHTRVTGFRTGPDGVDIGGVSVSIDAYKMTALGIDCGSFIS